MHGLEAELSGRVTRHDDPEPGATVEVGGGSGGIPAQPAHHVLPALDRVGL